MKKEFLLGLCLFFTCACSEEEGVGEYPLDENVQFVQSVMVGDNTYINTFKDLGITATTNDNALVFAKSAFMCKNNKNDIFIIETANARIYKYKVQDGNLIKDTETLVLPSGSLPLYITFASDEKAYISCVGSGVLTIFNPTTMEIIKNIDLSSYAVGKENGDKNPEPANAIIRDNQLYLCLIQDKSQYNPNKGAYVLILDTTTDEPIKMISDDRATMISNYEGVSGDPFMDEQGDIYFYCNGNNGYGQDPDGFLRIKKGETEFDKSYIFKVKGTNIADIKNNYSDFVYQKTYAENGLLYCYLDVPGNYSSPADYQNDKVMQPAVLDIYNKTIKILDFDASVSWATAISKQNENIIYGMTSTQGTGYYVYNYKNNTYTPMKIEVEGTPFRLLTLD